MSNRSLTASHRQRPVWDAPYDRDDQFIDTADSYGPLVSERIIALALYPYPPDVVIATKAGFVRPGPNEWTPNDDPKHLRAREIRIHSLK